MIFTQTDKDARNRAIARAQQLAHEQEQRELAYRKDQQETNDKEKAMSVAQVARNLSRKVRTAYRNGKLPTVTVRINPAWHHTPGRTAIREQLEARLKRYVGEGISFKVEVTFFDDIFPAEDEHDQMLTFPAGKVTLTVTPPH